MTYKVMPAGRKSDIIFIIFIKLKEDEVRE